MHVLPKLLTRGRKKSAAHAPLMRQHWNLPDQRFATCPRCNNRWREDALLPKRKKARETRRKSMNALKDLYWPFVACV